MRMIIPSVSMITEKNPFKKIEKVGRTCYKSEDKITEDSARKFYRSLVNRKHTAMVEHATFVFQTNQFVWEKLRGCKYLNYTCDNGRYLIGGNLRALNEFGSVEILNILYHIDPELVYSDIPIGAYKTLKRTLTPVDIYDLENLTENEFMNHAYFTFHFITDRGVTHEMVRHRPASYAQESTRYWNYAKEKFGSELTFIKPTGWDKFPDDDKLRFCNAFEKSEEEYNELIERGYTPQQARAVLPNALKTEIIMTAPAYEWEHFFDLRSRGTTGAPHPDIKFVADIALSMYDIEKDYLLGIIPPF